MIFESKGCFGEDVSVHLEKCAIDLIITKSYLISLLTLLLHIGKMD